MGDKEGRRRGGAGQHASLYEEVTARVLAELEQGRVPRAQPWGAARVRVGMPESAAAGRAADLVLGFPDGTEIRAGEAAA